MSEIPEWAVKEATDTLRGTMANGSPLFIERVALAISAAYTRGQMDMRERAAAESVTAGPRFYYNQHGQTRGTSELEEFISRSIRSLPLQDEEGK